jgi:hypothetical protein
LFIRIHPIHLTLLTRVPLWRAIPSRQLKEVMEEAYMDNHLPEIHDAIRQLNETISVLNQSVQQLIAELQRSPSRDMNARSTTTTDDRSLNMLHAPDGNDAARRQSMDGDVASNFRMQNAEQLWFEVLNRMREHMSEASFLTWFDGTKVVGLNETERRLVVSVPSMFAKNWIENHYREQVTSELRHITGEKYEVEFVMNYEE